MALRPFTALAAAAALLMAGCGGCSRPRPQDPDAADVLISVGDSALTRAQVKRLIPEGLSAADSARMFDDIVQSWLERNMLVNMAGGNIPDLDKIDRMVEQYRLQLLANEYRRAMARDHAAGVNADSVRAYYNTHPAEFKLQAPAIKGIYVKVSARAPQSDRLRAWMRSAKPSDIDQLEAYGLKGAMEYDYFGDTWVAWESIAERIPHRFADPDQAVASGPLIECEEDGSLYLLRILESIPSGELMPFDFAEAEITRQFMERNREAYDRTLLHSLYDKGRKEERVRPGSYTPVAYR